MMSDGPSEGRLESHKVVQKLFCLDREGRRLGEREPLKIRAPEAISAVDSKVLGRGKESSALN